MKKQSNVEIGDRLRAARRASGLTQEQLAEKLDLSSLFLSYVECGQKGMSLQTLEKICRTLDVTADYLLLGRGPQAAPRQGAQVYALLDSLPPEYLPLAEEALRTLLHTVQAVENAERKKQKVK